MNSAPAPLALDSHASFRLVNDVARSTGWLHGPAVAYASYGVVVFGVLLVAGFLLARARRDPASWWFSRPAPSSPACSSSAASP